LLGQPDEYALGASEVAEPIHVFVLDHFVDKLPAVLAEPGQPVVEVVHREHDAEVAEGVNSRGTRQSRAADARPDALVVALDDAC
jgi:hypothetical protein